MKLKLLVFLKLVFLVNLVFAENSYKLEIFFTNSTESLQLSEDTKYLHINSRGVWKDSFGDYGNIKCLGGVLQDNNKSSLNAYCEGINQNNIRFWIKLIRESDRDAGIGSSVYLNGEKKYKKFVGMKCVYASKVFGIDAIVNQKCKLN